MNPQLSLVKTNAYPDRLSLSGLSYAYRLGRTNCVALWHLAKIGQSIIPTYVDCSDDFARNHRKKEREWRCDHEQMHRYNIADEKAYHS